MKSRVFTAKYFSNSTPNFQNNYYILNKYNMNSSQKGGKSKSSKNSSSKSKKGGNFLGSVSELFVPTGWESFATAAGLLAIDRADAALRRKREKSSVKKGGMRGGDPMEDAEKIKENNPHLINSFLQLCGRIFILPEEEKIRMISKLNTLIKKEIKYRQTILELIQDEEMKEFLRKSLDPLIYMLSLLIKNKRNAQNYPIFTQYRENFRYIHRHQLPEETPNLKHNKILSNLDNIYSNKNKYPNSD